MRQLPHVDHFTGDIRSRLNRHRLYNALVWASALAAAAMVVVGLWYVVPGYSVPLLWYAWIGGAALAMGLVAWAGRRVDAEAAARVADDFYGLKDSVVSSRHFAQAGKQGGFYDLQAEQTESRVSDLTPAAIKYKFPLRLFGCAILLAVIAGALGFKAPSERVQKQIALEQQVLDETSQMNEELESLIDELDKQIDGTLEEELIDANELRKWVEALAETTDRKEALRQYAHLEQKLEEASSRLEQRRDERLLDRAAKELEQDRATKELAKDLEQKKYEQAADELKELKPQEKTLSEQQKELARLKAAAGRMTAAAGALKQSEGNDDGKEFEGEADELADEDGELDELIEDLDEAIEDWEEALEEIELAEAEFGEFDEDDWEECEICRAAVDDELDRFGERLRRLALKRAARAKLKKLCRAASQCQSGLCKSPNAGGRKAGEGTNDATREERDELIDNEQYTQLKGVKGSGPSLTKIEAAADGDGVSTRHGGQRERTFQRQIESFVEREDVPEDVKAGVKEYFKNIHQIEPAAADADSAADSPIDSRAESEAVSQP